MNPVIIGTSVGATWAIMHKHNLKPHEWVLLFALVCLIVLCMCFFMKKWR